MLETGEFKVTVKVDGNNLGDLLMLLTEKGFKGKAKLVRTTTMADYLPTPPPAKAKAKPRRKPASRAPMGSVEPFIMEWVEKHAGDGAFKAARLVGAGNAKFPPNSIRSVLARMVKAGTMLKTSRGTYRLAGDVAEAAE